MHDIDATASTYLMLPLTVYISQQYYLLYNQGTIFKDIYMVSLLKYSRIQASVYIFEGELLFINKLVQRLLKTK